MFVRKTELKVPIRDRRRRRRILTLKNFGAAMLMLLVVLVAANFIAEVRDERADHTSADYGRLVNGELPSPPAVATRDTQPVTEAPVDDQTASDPMLTAPAAREQYLGTTTQATDSAALMTPPAAAPVAPQPLLAHGAGSLEIVGDGSGVAVVAQPAAPAHKLSGGIFK